MSKQKWFDRNGAELRKGDKVRNVFSGKLERIYECHPEGRPHEVDLGFNASNEAFLKNHPKWPREIYPLRNFEHYLIEGQLRLVDYEKVV